jgi:hypothetical protein
VHRQKWTEALYAAWMDYDEEDANADANEMDFELWHALPPGIPRCHNFATVMEAHVADSTRAEADACGTVRRRARAATDARRHKFNKVLEDHAHVIREVNRVVQHHGYVGWIQAIDLVCAAHAFELRWMFRAAQSRYGDWRRARYRLLEIEPAALRVGAQRVEHVASALCATLVDANLPLDGNCSTRACVLEIIKHLPGAFLDAPWTILDRAVRHLRQARITLRLQPPRPGGALSRLIVDIAIDNTILQRSTLSLEVVVTKFVANQLHDLLGVPKTEALSTQDVATLEAWANQMSYQCWTRDRVTWNTGEPVITPGRDRVRYVLYRMPGGWPTDREWFD